MTAMGATRMHPDEVGTDVGLVRRLLAGQFPHWADLPVAPVASYGTDHDIYRLGDQLAARLPRIGWALFQALAALPYHWETNPGMVRQASHALGQVLARPDAVSGPRRPARRRPGGAS